MRVDVAVIGLGVMGSAALWRVAARGATTVGFEQFDLAHDKGSSHGASRVIRTAYFEDPQYVPLVQHAFSLWRRLQRESDTALLTMTGALMIGRPGSNLIAGTLASTRHHSLAYEILDAGLMRERYPQHRLAPDEIAVYEAGGGVLRPEEAVTAAVQRAETLGATVRRRTRVEHIEVSAGGVQITAAGLTYEAQHAIVAVGPWLGDFLPAVQLPLRVERQVQAWFPVRSPDLYSPQRFPVYMRDIGAKALRYGFPTLDGATVKIAVHHDGELTSASNIDRGVHPHDLDPLQRFVRDYLHGVDPVAVRSEVCMYTNTPDDHFLVGSVPEVPALTVLGGFCGHGFKFAPVIGDAAADLALGGQTHYPIDFFRLDRFALPDRMDPAT